VPDPVREGGELPRAYIVRRSSGDDAAPSEAEVSKLVAEQLASYKRLEGGIVFVPAIPKNASGKILKKDLRERAKLEMLRDKREVDAKL
jgi:acyl-CoA synthetase (AMP-forming)/AMP-acid ligase II